MLKTITVRLISVLKVGDLMNVPTGYDYIDGHLVVREDEAGI